MPLVKIDFYRVYLPPDSEGTFKDLLLEIQRRPIQQRDQNTTGGWIYLIDATIAQDRSHLRGVIVKVKADELPPSADRAGVLQDLPLNRDQGIAGVTHFYYRLSNAVLVLQRNFQGVRAPAFEYYVNRMTHTNAELRPILQREVLRRLRRLRVLRKVQLKVANPQALFHVGLGRSVQRIVDMMNEYEALVAEVTLGVGYRREGSLNVDGIRTLVERLFRFRERSDAVKGIVVLGREHEEEKTLVLDLLEGKIVETADIPVGANRRLSEQALVRALGEAYQQHEEEITELIGD